MQEREKQIAGAVLAAVGIIAILSFFRRDKPEFEIESSSSTQKQQEIQKQEKNIVVHVAGRVQNPGVYTLPSGARVYEAISKAGGTLPEANADALNLARTLSDGEKVLVPAQGENTGTLNNSTNRSTSNRAVPINRANEAELMTLPGIGPATARKIIAFRDANGPFTKAEDLLQVPGIGPKKLATIRAYISIP